MIVFLQKTMEDPLSMKQVGLLVRMGTGRVEESLVFLHENKDALNNATVMRRSEVATSCEQTDLLLAAIDSELMSIDGSLIADYHIFERRMYCTAYWLPDSILSDEEPWSECYRISFTQAATFAEERTLQLSAVLPAIPQDICAIIVQYSELTILRKLQKDLAASRRS